MDAQMLLMPSWPIVLIIVGACIMIAMIFHMFSRHLKKYKKDDLVVIEDKDGKGKHWKW